MRRHPSRAEVNPSSPRAWATCDLCGFVTNHYKLSWKREWAGRQIVNQRLLVCEYCLDIPQRQLGTIILPPDPPPIMNARPEQYAIDEVPVSTRVTMSGQVRVIALTPYPQNRIVSVAGDIADI